MRVRSGMVLIVTSGHCARRVGSGAFDLLRVWRPARRPPACIHIATPRRWATACHRLLYGDVSNLGCRGNAQNADRLDQLTREMRRTLWSREMPHTFWSRGRGFPDDARVSVDCWSVRFTWHNAPQSEDRYTWYRSTPHRVSANTRR